MALVTAGARVGAVERPTGAVVIERLGTSVGPLDQVEVAAGVLRMTVAAFPRHTSVQPAPMILQPTDLPMTGEAFPVECVLTAAVAFEALQVGIQVGVGSGQWSGRNLTTRPPGREEQQHHHSGRAKCTPP